MRQVSGLTLCGKRINQYCDTNKDKRISISEWTLCLDVAVGKLKQVKDFYYISLNIFAEETDEQIVSKSQHRPNINQRRGPNPLKTWLKGD